MELKLEADGSLNVDSFYTPLPKQAILHSSRAKNLLGIGGNNSGKSIFLIGEGVYNCLEYPGANVLLLRRDFPELEKGLILDFKNTVPKELFHWNDQKHLATFGNGSKLFFGHLSNGSETDLAQYLSAAFVFIGVDELGQFSFKAWNFLSSRNRVNKGCQPNADGYMPICRMGAATNPLGPGYGWIKSVWVDHKPVSQLGECTAIKGKWYSRVYDQTLLADDEFKKKLTYFEGDPWICVYDPAEYHYVHSTIMDNPYAAARDPDAITKLMRLAPDLRQKALYGDLNSISGAYFSNFSHERHIVRFNDERIQRESWQPIWLGIDWGLAHHTVVYWCTRAKIKDIDGTFRPCVLTFRELAVNETGYKDLCRLISEATPPDEKKMLKYTFLSHERFNRTNDTQHTVADEMTKEFRLYDMPPCSMANKRREDGAVFMYNLLENGEWVIQDNCQHLIQSLETRERDMPDHPEDVRKYEDLGDDAYDAIRYALLSMLREKGKPEEIKYQEKLATIPDPTARMMFAYQHHLKEQERGKPIVPKVLPRWRVQR